MLKTIIYYCSKLREVINMPLKTLHVKGSCSQWGKVGIFGKCLHFIQITKKTPLTKIFVISVSLWIIINKNR